MAGALGAAFIPYYGQLIEILETNPEMKKSAKGIFKQVAWGAGGTAVGGVLLGPAGALVGGVAGSLIGYLKSDDYQAMIVVMKNLSDSEKEQIVKKVQELVGSVGIEELVRFVGSQVQRDALLHLLRGCLSDLKGG
ncbi:protein C19orf12 homolog [Argopecten irradians]|uniref:protein C19orf12 homolog n=1 Tax=Argopecten irradians TaxID=31199 RepID=UPI00371A37F3